MKSSRLLFSTLVALSLALLLSGCGEDTAPTAVTTLDQTAPAAPTELTKVTDASYPYGLLAWKSSTSAAVAGYEVYEYQPDPDREDAYVLVGQLDAATLRFPLPSCAEPQTLYYRIKAVSGAGVKSAWSVTSAIYVCLLSTGADEPQGGEDEPVVQPVLRP